MSAKINQVVIKCPIKIIGASPSRVSSPRRSYFRVPAEMAALRNPKPEIAGLRDGARFYFEQGGYAFEHSRLPGRFKLRQLVSGAMTIMDQECGRTTYENFGVWSEQAGIRDLPSQEALRHAREITRRLNSLGIRLSNEIGIRKDELMTRNGEAWQIIDQVLSVLPDKVLANGDLKKIVVGSSRVGAAQASAYDDHKVYIYYGAMRGSRRELIAKVLHEIGHSTAESLGKDVAGKLKMAHAILVDDLIGLDILGGPEYRKSYQRDFHEFIADNLSNFPLKCAIILL